MRSNVILDPLTQRIYEEVPAPAIRYLVFEGGGIRGLAYSGLVEILDQVGMLKDIEHVAGSSIGSIAAILVALGCRPSEIQVILDQLPYKSFLEGKDPSSYLQFMIAVFIKRHFSLASGSKLKEWINNLLKEKLGSRDATFADLARKVEETKHKEHQFKYLSVVGSNISKNRLQVFNHENTSNMPIADAILISASYPGVFKPVEWNDSLYLDGGVMNNLPSFIFNDKRYLPAGYEFNEKGANPAVLHIKIDNLEEMSFLWNNYRKKTLKTTYEYCIAVLYGMQSRDGEISEQIPTNIVQIYDYDVDTFKVSITHAEKQLLLDSGKESMLQWLYNRYCEAYEIKAYEDEADWLASKSLNELFAIKHYYTEQLEKITDGSEGENIICQQHLLNKIESLSVYIANYTKHLEEVPAVKKSFQEELARLERNPTVKNVNDRCKLHHKIDSFSGCFKSYKELMAFLDKSIKINMVPHIDIHTIKPRKDTDNKIRQIVEERIQFLQGKIDFLNSLIEEIKSRICSLTERGSEINIHDEIVYLNLLLEELKLFGEVQDGLKLTLNLPRNPPPPHSNYNKMDDTENCFQEDITEILNKRMAAWNPHHAFTQQIDVHLKDGSLVQEEGKEIVSLDLCIEEDFKLYIFSSMLYLKLIDSSSEISNCIEKTYQRLFKHTPVPLDMNSLGAIFEKQGPDLMVLSYRIERLLKYFAGIDKPKDKMKSLIKIDDVFWKLSDSKCKLENIFAKYQKGKIIKKKSDEIEMTFFYKPFSRSGKFLMFHADSMRHSPLHHSRQDRVHTLLK